MDAKLRKQAETLATEIAGQATTVEELNGLMRTMMKSASWPWTYRVIAMERLSHN